MKQYILGIILFAIWHQPAMSCTSFFLEDQSEMALVKGYDWHLKHGYMLVNPRGLKKSSLAIKPNDLSIQWTSKYGSITFNQFGISFPNGGMNEQGLVIEVLRLGATTYEPANQKPTVNELEWIQYALDNYSDVYEMLESVNNLRLSSLLEGLHYFACDKSKNCAVFEFINGRLETNSSFDTNFIKGITNHPYRASASYASKFQPWGGQSPLSHSASASLDRFVYATGNAKTYTERQDISNIGFQILKKVQLGSYTKWNQVYDLKRNQISFKNLASNTSFKISMANANFECRDNQYQSLDLLSNNQSLFLLNKSQNDQMVSTSLGNDLPDFVIKQAQDHYTKFKCE